MGLHCALLLAFVFWRVSGASLCYFCYWPAIFHHQLRSRNVHFSEASLQKDSLHCGLCFCMVWGDIVADKEMIALDKFMHFGAQELNQELRVDVRSRRTGR